MIIVAIATKVTLKGHSWSTRVAEGAERSTERSAERSAR
jgi:hypothetical protein